MDPSTAFLGIEPKLHHAITQKFQQYVLSLGTIEPWTNPLCDMTGCEDPKNLTTFNYLGKKWAMVQTGQMDLEWELLRKPKGEYPGGLFCQTRSWREEMDPDPNGGASFARRHWPTFKMFEYEQDGNMNDLKTFVCGLLRHLGYRGEFAQGTYDQICARYGTKTIEAEHEQMIYKDFGPVFFLTDFPEHTSPFWNIERIPGTHLSRKMDVILSGMETIGCGVRSCNAMEMHDSFYSISDGQYATELFRKVGKDKIVEQLSNYLNLSFRPRFGLGIGFTRLAHSLIKEGLLDPANPLAYLR